MADRPPPLAYGTVEIDDYLPEAVLNEGRLLPLVRPAPIPEHPSIDAGLERALDTSSTPQLGPSLKARLDKGYRGGDVVIVVDDYTRPCLHQRRLLPGVLAWLRRHGVPKQRVWILAALATHRDPRPEEWPAIVGEGTWSEWRDQCVPHHDEEDLVRLGTAPDGTPVELNGRAARSEILLSLSDLDYHYFAGVTGGPKQLVPGIAGRALTTADHLRMFGPLGFAANVDMGILDSNPVYEYKRAVVRIALDALAKRGTFVYAVIAVLDPGGRFVALAGGEVLELHRKLRPVLDRVYVAEAPRRADIVIVAAKHLGINVYQAGKAINAAARAVRAGGMILCLAPCADGIGNDEFRRLMGLAVPFLRDAERRIAQGADPDTEGLAAIESALAAVQVAAMNEFRIGKQKPVDLLAQYRHAGWGNLWLLCDGLSKEERAFLPFRYVGTPGEHPAQRLRAWVEMQEAREPTYVVIDDPTYLIRARA